MTYHKTLKRVIGFFLIISLLLFTSQTVTAASGGDNTSDAGIGFYFKEAPIKPKPKPKPKPIPKPKPKPGILLPQTGERSDPSFFYTGLVLLIMTLMVAIKKIVVKKRQ